VSQITDAMICEHAIAALERTAFVLAEAAEDPAAAEGFAPTLHTCIGYQGVANGSIVLAADDDFVRELASSMLGIEADAVCAPTTGLDALNELANIIGGSIIVDLGGESQRYRYGLPTPLASDSVPESTPTTVSTLVRSETGMLGIRWIPGLQPERLAA